ncbi:hypothetical protein PVK06_002945 [Gossypium arboreum]|uniref:DUF4283 domain-containing protein n=1 Tax=Gossypium arboreum TaxID=29729 RepID=A0ABR0R633_GOSAR|nr:hypothetical protein PVK06_002945 [Gossypium arboreum]
MVIENGYFLAKFQNKDDFEKVLSQGSWIIYRQYLTVQSWTTDFNLMQPYLSVVKEWIRLSGSVGMKISLKEGVLDPSRHWAIFLKKNLASVGEKELKGNSSVETRNGIYVGKGRGNGGKAESNRNGKILNKTI